MKTALLLTALSLCGCTAAQGQLVGRIATGVCDAGMMIIGIPGAEPICADINVVEQIIANWNAPANAAMHAARPITDADIYQAVKASGKFKAVH